MAPYPKPQLVSAMSKLVFEFCRMVLEDTLETIAAQHGEVSDTHRVLAELRAVARNRFGVSSVECERAYRALNAAATLVGEVAEGYQAARCMHVTDTAAMLEVANEALVSAVDLPSLRAALAAQLPHFKMSSFFLCEFDQEKAPAEYARLLVARHHGAGGATYRASIPPPG